jgi:L-ascorbate metabolism protein UlaG (beta-lactamase superfamily)
MKITYLGHAAFIIETEGKKILIDPYDPGMLGMQWKEQSADIVCVSHNHEDHNFVKGVSGDPFVINAPGEYEVSNIRIQGLPAFHDNSQGNERGANTLYVIESEGIFVAHFGDIGHELLDEQEEKLGTIDVLMVPVGGVFTITAKQAAEMVADIEPFITIPMHYGIKNTKGVEWGLSPLEDFLKEMGEEDLQPQKNLEIKNKSSLPEESEVIILQPQFA